MKTLSEILRDMQRERERETLPCGFPSADCWGLLQKGEVTVLGARPGMGKTTFALQIAAHVAGVSEHTVLWFGSAGTSARGLAEALSLKLPLKYYVEPAYQRVWIECREWNLSRIRETVREIPQPPTLIIIDDLEGFYVPSKKGRPLYDAARVCRKIQEMARETGAAVLVTSKLTRAPEMRKGHDPRFTDLPDWESIASFVDIVCLFFREGYYDWDVADSARTDFDVSPCGGYGGTGVFYLEFHNSAEAAWFSEIREEDFFA